MAETFRTTVSAVFWAETADEADAIVEAINAAIPGPWDSSTLATTERKSEGPPMQTVETEEPPADGEADG